MEIESKLKELQEYSASGHLCEVLYRVVAFNHYIVEAVNAEHEVYDAIDQWLETNNKLSLDFFDSILLLYQNYGWLDHQEMQIFTKYRPHFDQAVKYLLGELEWKVPAYVDEKCKKYAMEYTKTHLNHVLTLD